MHNSALDLTSLMPALFRTGVSESFSVSNSGEDSARRGPNVVSAISTFSMSTEVIVSVAAMVVVVVVVAAVVIVVVLGTFGIARGLREVAKWGFSCWVTAFLLNRDRADRRGGGSSNISNSGEGGRRASEGQAVTVDDAIEEGGEEGIRIGDSSERGATAALRDRRGGDETSRTKGSRIWHTPSSEIPFSFSVSLHFDSAESLIHRSGIKSASDSSCAITPARGHVHPSIS